jgi:endonuclease/exonuclease/phosphatase family metal-dependent hydrolase
MSGTQSPCASGADRRGLKETSGDVIALQEVAGMDHADPQHNQVRWIAGELGFHYRIGANRRLHGAAYGNAVLARLPIAASHNHDITWRKSEPRGCLDVLLELGGREALHRLRIFKVHLGTGYFERRHQSKKLFDIMKDGSHDSAPRFVLGVSTSGRVDSRRTCWRLTSIPLNTDGALAAHAVTPAFCRWPTWTTFTTTPHSR